MKTIRLSLLILFASGLLNGCTFVSNVFTYRDTVKELVNDILKQDYDNAVKHFALEHPSFAGTTADTLKTRLPAFRDIIVNNFGEQIEYSMMTAEKKWSTEENESTPPNTTIFLMQISNKTDFGVLKVWFDDSSKKVVFIKTLDVKRPIPSMTFFWLFGLVAICIPIFNIYMIIRVKRSNLKKKWQKYLAIILLNVPAITYKAIGGLSYSLLSFQILLGFSFSYMGYISAAWTFGIPLGGLYVLWKLRKERDENTYPTTESVTTEQKIGGGEMTDTVTT